VGKTHGKKGGLRIETRKCLLQSGCFPIGTATEIKGDPKKKKEGEERKGGATKTLREIDVREEYDW